MWSQKLASGHIQIFKSFCEADLGNLGSKGFCVILGTASSFQLLSRIKGLGQSKGPATKTRSNSVKL